MSTNASNNLMGHPVESYAMLKMSCRQMPGPSVVVCQGDTVVAKIVNKLHTETTSVHWHGKYRVIHLP